MELQSNPHTNEKDKFEVNKLISWLLHVDLQCNSDEDDLDDAAKAYLMNYRETFTRKTPEPGGYRTALRPAYCSAFDSSKSLLKNKDFVVALARSPAMHFWRGLIWVPCDLLLPYCAEKLLLCQTEGLGRRCWRFTKGKRLN